MIDRVGRLAPLAVLCLGLVAVPSAHAPAADTWLEVVSPNFRVVSNNGERSARQTAWQFEQIRAAVSQGWPWAQAPLDRPLLIVGVKDEGTMKVFAPGYFEKGQSVRYASISASDWDRHYIMMRADLLVDGGEGVNPYRTAYWTYCDLLLSSAFHSRLPLWFTRGMAAVLSNTNVTDKEVQVGRAVPSYIDEFKSGARFPLEQLFTLTRQAPEMQREVDRRRFDAEAWALVHYMLFGEPDTAGRENRLNALARALTSGVPSVEAVGQIYGPLASVDTAYRRYVDRGLFRFVTMRADIQVSQKDFTVQPVSPASVAAIRAGYLGASRRPDDARAAILQARQLAPSDPAAYDVEGLLFEHENKLDEARAAYEKSVELKSTNFLAYVRLASLLARTPAPDTLPTRRTLLERAVALNPAYASSQQALSAVLLQMGLPKDAIEPARRAVALAPSQVFNHTALASALARAGLKDDALAEARVAMTLATSDVERRSVQSVIDMIDRIR